MNSVPPELTSPSPLSVISISSPLSVLLSSSILLKNAFMAFKSGDVDENMRWNHCAPLLVLPHINLAPDPSVQSHTSHNREPMQEKLSSKTRALTYTRFAFSLCVLWRVREAILWWLSLWKRGDGNYEGGARTQLPLSTLRKPPPSLLEMVVIGGLLYPLVGGRRYGKH